MQNVLHFGFSSVQFGGNPVSCAAVLAVLRVLRNENLQQNARDVGDYFLQRLRKLQQRHDCMGDVRLVYFLFRTWPHE